MELIKPDHYHIPRLVADEVGAHESFVFAIIYWFVKMKEGRCYASNERIAQALPYNSSNISVANALSVLEEKGFVERIFADKSKRNRVEILCLVSTSVSPTGDRGITPRLYGVSPTGEQNKNRYREEIIRAPRDFTVVEESPDGESKSPKKPRDRFLVSAATVWHKKCKEEFGREPSGGLAKSMKVLSDARKYLTDEQVKEKMMDWFKESDLEEHEMMQITRCFSTFQIDKYISSL